MKHSFALSFLLLSFLFAFAGCRPANTVDAKINGVAEKPISSIHTPPNLTIVCHEKSERVTDWAVAQCPRFEWKPYGGSVVNADGSFVFELWLNGELKSFDLSEVKRVDFNFEVSPDRIVVTAWRAECVTENHSRNAESAELPVKDGLFSLPAYGTYLYAVILHKWIG